jgi:hypothetical protein
VRWGTAEAMPAIRPRPVAMLERCMLE